MANKIIDATGVAHDILNIAHENRAVINKFGEDANGLPTYNGNAVDTTIAQRDVYDALDGTDNTISLSATQGKALNDRVLLNDVKATNVSTNLSVSATETNVTVESSDGTNATIASASSTSAGIMTKATFDKIAKVDTTAIASMIVNADGTITITT